MKHPIIGWDVGGANIKAVCLDAASPGSEPRVIQRAFPLWREPDRLASVLEEVTESLLRGGDGRPEVAVTMTAELADCFATKREGVVFILNAFRSAFPETELHVFGVDGRFRSVDAARRAPHDVAAANWMASATWVSRTFPDVLLIDVGSTTTDIIPIVGGRVAATGRTDTARLTTGELVYTGVLRTPVCAVIRSVPRVGGECRIAAEHFAIAADAYRWLGRIEDAGYTCETPDGKGTGRTEAGARLARMVCADLETLADDEITAIARHVEATQIRQIGDGIRQVIDTVGPTAPVTVLLAGEGVFLARASVERMGLKVCELADTLGVAGARSGPAAAVAFLLAGMVRVSGSSAGGSV